MYCTLLIFTCVHTFQSMNTQHNSLSHTCCFITTCSYDRKHTFLLGIPVSLVRECSSKNTCLSYFLPNHILSLFCKLITQHFSQECNYNFYFSLFIPTILCDHPLKRNLSFLFVIRLVCDGLLETCFIITHYLCSDLYQYALKRECKWFK